MVASNGLAMLAMGGQNNNPILGMVKTLLTPLLVLLIKTFALVLENRFIGGGL